MDSFSNHAWGIFNQAIFDYHKTDHVDAEEANPYPTGTLEQILYGKNWIDTIQWHLEDIIRDENISPADALQIKRRIDASNQKRTNLVEDLDFWFLQQFSTVVPHRDARINTETPAWAVDRLSILALKIFHMAIEAGRESADDAHRLKCREKLQVLEDQKIDLSKAIDDLLTGIQNGNVKMKLYKQMKMYNDESLNPVLYQNAKK